MQLLFELCRFRNRHPAFNGTFELLDTLTHVKDAVVIGDDSLPTDDPRDQEGSFLNLDCGSDFQVTSDVHWCAAAQRAQSARFDAWSAT
jgi:hypothetical protein